ncbi:MAG TPA: FAD-dependent oxidoreductase, partial [Candidatus Binataceae bacterium]|nr:FAD-dependent oxidoreductase [Candidatus Binataceae bacterium]
MARTSPTTDCDVLVVGAGNAALCAALAAREQGARVIALERAPETERGGNTAFTAGGFRVAYNNLDELLELMPDLSDEEKANTDFGTYTEDQYFEDVGRVTEYRTNPDMVELLVRRSRATLLWMRTKGVRWVPMYGRQAYKVDGRFKFWGGLTVEAWGGGPGLIDALHQAARREGVEVRYGARAVSLIHDDGGV